MPAAVKMVAVPKKIERVNLKYLIKLLKRLKEAGRASLAKKSLPIKIIMSVASKTTWKIEKIPLSVELRLQK